MRSQRVIGPALVALFGAWLVPGAALALSASAARARADKDIAAAEVTAGKINAASSKGPKALTPSERIARGEVLLRTKDYERAIEVLCQVVELHRQGKVPATAAADATFLLAEAYFESDQLLSAKREYASLVDRGAQAAYSAFAGRSLSRLVDIALRTDRLEDIDVILSKLSSLPSSDASGSLQYARGKAYFAKRDYAAAKASASAVPASSPYALQAQYLLGVILVKEASPAPPPSAPAAGAPAAGPAPAPTLDGGRYAAAVNKFMEMSRLPAKTAADRHVVDLAWMAVGRLLYETEQYLDAADAYGHVDRSSPEFSTMLFELAWVYVRLADYPRAQRALEVLTLADPDTAELADGTLLKADLMLRAGQYREALEIYEGIRSRFDPIREQVARFLSEVSDPGVYYDAFVQDPVEQPSQGLPALALKWAREAAADDRVFAVIDDAARSRDLVRRTRVLAAKLGAALASPTRVRAFPELLAQLRLATGAANQVGRARRVLAEGLDDVAGSSGSGELRDVRAKRRALMKRLGMVPVTSGEFARRDASGEQQWNRVSQQLQRLTLEADSLQALVNGLRRVLKDAEARPGSVEAESRKRFEAEIAEQERQLVEYRKRIKSYQEMVEVGRVQIGFGDQRFIDDEATRREFRTLFAREVALCAGGADGAGAAEYAQSIQPLIGKADALEGRLDATRQSLARSADERARSLKEEVAREAANIEAYSAQLDALDSEARVVVGEAAMRSFALVRDRLKSVVLRADVGVAQHAWETRETQRLRVRDLQRERALEDQKLNDELREVLDDAEAQ